MPKSCSLAKRCLWETESKALAKSKKTTSVSLPESKAEAHV